MLVDYIKKFLTILLYSSKPCLGVNLIKREIPLVVSISSKREHFKILPKVLNSIFAQTLKPDKVVLWLDKDNEELLYLPYDISQFIKFGLEIRFVKYIGNFTGAIYALKEFVDSAVVTADSSAIYNKNWLRDIYLSYLVNQEDIQVCKAHKILLDNNSLVLEDSPVLVETAGFSNFILSPFGNLYPPHCFTLEVFREDIFLKYSNSSPEAWFWTMALISGRKIRVIKQEMKRNFILNFIEKIYNKKSNLNNAKIALNNLLKFYKRNIFNCLK